MHGGTPTTFVIRAIGCTAVVALLAVPQTYAQARDKVIGSPTSVGTAWTDGTVRTVSRPTVSPREWPLIAAAEHSTRLSLEQTGAASATRAGFQRRGRAYRHAQRLTAAIGLGFLGSLAGGAAGFGIGRLGSEDAALQGMGVGMCLGAAAGATIGVLLVK